MSLEFRHVIDEQDIGITITKNELVKEFENLMNDLKQKPGLMGIHFIL
jgi:hypothetical protein